MQIKVTTASVTVTTAMKSPLQTDSQSEVTTTDMKSTHTSYKFNILIKEKQLLRVYMHSKVNTY